MEGRRGFSQNNTWYSSESTAPRLTYGPRVQKNVPFEIPIMKLYYVAWIPSRCDHRVQWKVSIEPESGRRIHATAQGGGWPL